MKLLENISWHEMRRRWFLGELESDSFGVPAVQRNEVRRLLESDDLEVQRIGVLHSCRVDFWNSFPVDTEWKTAALDIVESEFQMLRTISTEPWQHRTGGSYHLVDAATNIESGRRVDPRVSRMIDAYRRSDISFRGITLHSQSGSGFLTVAEGTARLIALYLCRARGKDKAGTGQYVEVILGTSATRWCYAPPG